MLVLATAATCCCFCHCLLSLPSVLAFCPCLLSFPALQASLMGMTLVIPVQHGRLALGMWQGIYLNEHRWAVHGGTAAMAFGPATASSPRCSLAAVHGVSSPALGAHTRPAHLAMGLPELSLALSSDRRVCDLRALTQELRRASAAGHHRAGAEASRRAHVQQSQVISEHAEYRATPRAESDCNLSWHHQRLLRRVVQCIVQVLTVTACCPVMPWHAAWIVRAYMQWNRADQEGTQRDHVLWMRKVASLLLGVWFCYMRVHWEAGRSDGTSSGTWEQSQK